MIPIGNSCGSGINVSSDLERTMRTFISNRKQLNKEFIAKIERFDSICEMVDLLS
jgi:hypothetical protein